MLHLNGKTCVILGGAGLIGSAFSRSCQEEGADVIIADINETRGEAFAKKIGASFVKTDVTSPESISSLAEELAKTHAHIDGVVNAAYPRSKNFGKSFDEASVEDMLSDISMLLGSCLAVTKAFSPVMRKQKNGSIVFLGSVYGVVAPRFEIYEGTQMTKQAEYAAAKGGTIMLAKYFASLLGRDGIRVNAISPGGVADDQPESFVKGYSKHLKLGSGLLAPEDLSGALLYLFSDASKMVTGQNLIIDGGWTI